LELREKIDVAPDGSRIKRDMIREFNILVGAIDRSVAVYGAIQLRTDGKNVVLAQKLERPRGKTRWEIYPLVSRGGALRYESEVD
jgi:hypothetical protein